MVELNVESTGILRVTNAKVTQLDGTSVDLTEPGTFTIYDATGAEVAGQVWPAALTLVTDGNYAGLIESDCELVASHHYDVKITIGTDVEKKHTWTLPVVAKKDVR